MEIFKRLFSYFTPHFYKIILSCICGAVAAGLDLASMWIIKIVIDSTLTKGQKIIYCGILLIGGIFIIKILLEYVEGMINILIERKVIYQLQRRLFAHFQKLPLNKISKYSIGENISRLINDIESLGNIMTSEIYSITNNVVLIIGAVVFLTLIDWKLFLLSIIVMPFALITLYFSRSKFQIFSKRVQEKLGILISFIQDTLSKIIIVKGFLFDGFLNKKFEKINNDYIVSKVHMEKLTRLFMGLVEIITSSLILILIWYGGMAIIQKKITLGELIAFIGYTSYLIGPLMMLGISYLSINEAIGIGRRYFEIIDEPQEDDTNRESLPTEIKEISSQCVGFKYEDKYVLKDINLTIRKGDKVAIIGPSGSGKSTLMLLLSSFYEPTNGVITINGKDMRLIKREDIRKKILYCSSSPMLFNTTVKENLTLGKEIKESQITEACRIACALDFILLLQDGFDTEIGKGINLSAGESQRLALARALLQDPEIFIFDETISSVDNDTQTKIMENLDKKFDSKTIICISHKLLPITFKKIFTMDNGKVYALSEHKK